MRSSIIVLLITSALLASCKKREIHTKAELVEYINDPANGLNKTDSAGKIKTDLLFEPWQLIAMRTGGQKNKDDVLTQNMKNKYFFVLSLSANNKELLKQLPFSQYSEMVQVLAFRMVSFVQIKPDSNMPVEPEECYFQQTYGMGGTNQLLMIFDKKKLQTQKQLNVTVKEFGLNIGDLNFEINKKDIDDLPTIIIK